MGRVPEGTCASNDVWRRGIRCPSGTPWASVRYPASELAGYCQWSYGTRDPSLWYYPEKGNVPSGSCEEIDFSFLQVIENVSRGAKDRW